MSQCKCKKGYLCDFHQMSRALYLLLKDEPKSKPRIYQHAKTLLIFGKLFEAMSYLSQNVSMIDDQKVKDFLEFNSDK